MRLSVPKPCHEDWNKMTLNEQGAFCKVCAKTVVDFSAMSDDEVLNYFKNKGEEKTCGRFRASQLTPYEFRVNVKQLARGRFPKIFAASMFIFFTSLFVCKSDTGQILPVSVLVDTFDTATFKLTAIDTATAIDSAVALTGDTLQEEINSPEISVITGAVHQSFADEKVWFETTEVKSFSEVTIVDTVPPVRETMILGGAFIEHTKPHRKPPTCVKRPPRRNDYIMGKMVKGEVEP